MSVYDVAAVDRLTSLQNRNAKRDDSLPSFSRRRKYEGGSLRQFDRERQRQLPDDGGPTSPKSPERDKRSDALKESLARHQASLSRRDSTFGTNDDICLNDDLPSAPRGYGAASTTRHRPDTSYFTPQVERRPQRLDGYYTVTSTKTMTSSKTMMATGCLEGGQPDRMWDTLPVRRREQESPVDHVGRSREELRMELSQQRYPYISSNTYSLPRNHRLMQANKRFSDTIRNSKETLMRSGAELAFRESRESLLKRYPSSSLRSSPTPTRHPLPAYSQSASASRSHSPSSSPCASPYCYSSARSSRNSSPHRSGRYHEGYYLNHPNRQMMMEAGPEECCGGGNGGHYQHHHHHHQQHHHNHYYHHHYQPPQSCCSSRHSSRNASRSGSPHRSGDWNGHRHFDRSARSSRRCSPEPAPLNASCYAAAAATQLQTCCSGSRRGSPAGSVRQNSCCPDESPPPLPPPCVVGSPTSLAFDGQPSRDGECVTVLSPVRDCTSPTVSCCSSKSRQRSPTCGRQYRGTQGCSQHSSRASSPLRTSRASSPLRTSRASSPLKTSSRLGSPAPSSLGPLDGVYRRILSPTKGESNSHDSGNKIGTAPVVMYVRETIQIVSPQDGPFDTLLRSLSISGPSQAIISGPDIVAKDPDQRSTAQVTAADTADNTITAANLGAIPKTSTTAASSTVDLSEILEAKVNQARSNRKSLSHMSLDQADRASIEKFLASLRHCQDGEAATVTMDNDDLDDSARADSVVSITSTNSNKSKEHRDYQGEGEDGNTHSTIRRQSVIIEGLTMETDELRRKVQNLEEELVSVPFVQEVQQKLQVVETKLEETESFCYQVVEENVGLKSEIEALEAEISEVQDTFREKDAKEFKRVKWELENLAKTCRNLQLKLSKAQAKANKLRQEKEQLEEAKNESTFLRTTVVFAAALLAGVHILAGKLKH